jgi:beta-galactosidase
MTTRRDLLKITGVAAGTLLTGNVAQAATASANGRNIISLDGVWDVAESVGADERPQVYDRRAPVPGLTHSAIPPFPDVDRFDSRERELMKQLNQIPFKKEVIEAGGISRQKRNYFWYRTYFTAPDRYNAATLKVNKAQFGSAVWLNGKSLGTEDSCFTATTYDIADAILWGERNELVIRIGAHPNVLPEGNVCNTDFEKARWTPGIWDSVSVWFNNGPSIIQQQVAPRIDAGEIVVQTVLKNGSDKPVSFKLLHSVTGLKADKRLTGAQSRITLGANEQRTITETIPFKDAQLWSPDSPTLYRLHTSTSGDETVTRFGMREFRFDTATKRAYLNGKMIFMRGSNITLHRFFEDPLSGRLPWDEQWVRKLLGTNRQQMNWNTIKFVITPVPQKWLDIADEVGLMVVYEFPIWVLSPEVMPAYDKKFDPKVLRREYERWLGDNWNHPSIIYWNAAEESALPPALSSEMITDVRKLDLSNRAWGNSWNPPVGPNDPSEDHIFLFIEPSFDMPMLEHRTGSARTDMLAPSSHAAVISEYGWLWVNRDGSIPLFSKMVWDRLPYPKATVEERFETYGYLLAGLTEYWRAHRNYAGLLYFCYLGASHPETWTSDNFSDVRALEFNPQFVKYVREAFKSLGVYINFWQRQLAPGQRRKFDVMMINDEYQDNAGTLTLRLEGAKGETLAEVNTPYLVAPMGQSTYKMVMELPAHEGHCVLVAQATPAGGKGETTTISRRWVELTSRPAPKPSAAAPANIERGQF